MAPRKAPTLGRYVCAWIEEWCVHGPGDKRGEPVELTREQKRFVWKAYELFPRGHARAGKRRYQRGVYSRIKGTAKSELGAWLVLAELCGPVRFDGWGAGGQPKAKTVVSPYIPVAATSEDQAEDTLWGAVYCIASEGPLAEHLDIGVDRIIDPASGGEAKVVTSSSISRDGGKPTFTACDETHLWFSAELKKLDGFLRRNLAKRPAADPWGFAATTMFAAGEQSVAEADWDAAEQKTPWLYLDHREAGPEHDTSTDEGLDAAIRDARGDATWLDPVPIMADYRRDPAEGERYWLNRRRRSARAALDPKQWDACADPTADLEAGEAICLGFDGSLDDDATVLVAASIETGLVAPLGIWQRPPELSPDIDWEVPRAEVLAAIADAFDTYDVLRFYADPPYWADEIAGWKATWGDKRVHAWWTNKDQRMGYATHRWHTAIAERGLRHNGTGELGAKLTEHVRNACRRMTRVRLEENGRLLWVLTKDRDHSPRKIDFAVGTVLAWEARADAISAGEHNKRKRRAGAFSY